MVIPYHGITIGTERIKKDDFVLWAWVKTEFDIFEKMVCCDIVTTKEGQKKE